MWVRYEQLTSFPGHVRGVALFTEPEKKVDSCETIMAHLLDSPRVQQHQHSEDSHYLVLNRKPPKNDNFMHIALFPGSSCLQFLIAHSCKNGEGRPGRFSHVHDIR